MALLGMILTNVSGTFDLDHKKVSLEWIAFSDNINDFPRSIAAQGTIRGSMIQNGYAIGWFAPGSPYRLGNDSLDACYAGEIEISNRKIISGRGDWDIQGITLVPIFSLNPVIRYNDGKHIPQKTTKKKPQKPQRTERTERTMTAIRLRRTGSPLP